MDSFSWKCGHTLSLMDLLKPMEFSFCSGSARCCADDAIWNPEVCTYSSLLIVFQTQDIFLQTFGAPVSQNKYHRHSDPSLPTYPFLKNNREKESSTPLMTKMKLFFAGGTTVFCSAWWRFPYLLGICHALHLPLLRSPYFRTICHS